MSTRQNRQTVAAPAAPATLTAVLNAIRGTFKTKAEQADAIFYAIVGHHCVTGKRTATKKQSAEDLAVYNGTNGFALNMRMLVPTPSGIIETTIEREYKLAAAAAGLDVKGPDGSVHQVIYRLTTAGDIQHGPAGMLFLQGFEGLRSRGDAKATAANPYVS